MLNFFSSILNASKENELLKEKNKRYQEEVTNLKLDIVKLNNQLINLKPRPVVGVDVGDPSPIKSEDRKNYVSQVAGFHKDILAPKLVQLIGDVRAQFEQISLPRFGLTDAEYDLYLKGTINAFWLLNEWGELMISEQLANQTESAEISEQEMQNLREKTNQ